MKQLNTTISKFCGAAALVMMMSTAAAAQDYTSQRALSETVLTSDQMEQHAQTPSFETQTVQTLPAATAPRTTRRIVREALPAQLKSTSTLNKGRVYTTQNHVDDAMVVYTPPARNSRTRNLYVSSAK